MRRRLFITLAPLLVTATFAIVTTAAQAESAEWVKNFTRIPTDRSEGIFAWGTLSYRSSNSGGAECPTAAGGNVENGTGREARWEILVVDSGFAIPRGFGDQKVFFIPFCVGTVGPCAALGGEATIHTTERSIDWRGIFDEETLGSEMYRAAQAQNVKLTFECVVEGEVTVSSTVFQTGQAVNPETGKAEGPVGTFTPAWQNGSFPGRPSEMIFGEGSGPLVGWEEVEVGEDGETPFDIENVKATKRSPTYTGTGFLKSGVKAGEIVNGLPVSTDGNTPTKHSCHPGDRSKSNECHNLTVVIAVNEKEITLGIEVYNEVTEMYEFGGTLAEATLTGTYTLRFSPGTNNFKSESVLLEILGKLKVEGFEGTPVPLITLEP